jgi:hypothetical protein
MPNSIEPAPISLFHLALATEWLHINVFFLYSNIKFHYTYSQGTKAEQSSGFLFSGQFKRSCREIMLFSDGLDSNRR